MDPVTIILWIVVIVLVLGLVIAAAWAFDKFTTRPAPLPPEETRVLDKDGNVIDEAWWARERQESKRLQALQMEEDKRKFDDELYQSMVEAGHKLHGPEHVPILLEIPPDSYYAGYSVVGDTIRIGGRDGAYTIRMGELGSFLEHLQRAIQLLSASGAVSQHYEMLQKDLTHLQFEFSMGLLPKPTPPVQVLPMRTNRNGNPLLEYQLAEEQHERVNQAIQDAQHQLMRQQEYAAYLKLMSQPPPARGDNYVHFLDQLRRRRDGN